MNSTNSLHSRIHSFTHSILASTPPPSPKGETHAPSSPTNKSFYEANFRPSENPSASLYAKSKKKASFTQPDKSFKPFLLPLSPLRSTCLRVNPIFAPAKIPLCAFFPLRLCVQPPPPKEPQPQYSGNEIQPLEPLNLWNQPSNP
jgi:hypothetical protein